MTLSESETSGTSECLSDRSASSADGSSKEKRERGLTKVVVRRLPSSMTEEIFLDQISPLPDHDYKCFIKADMSLGEFAFSRAYINFTNPADIYIFKEKFDNYVFLDAKGNEYPACVEFAPFPRVSKKRKKFINDPDVGTIESDEMYIEFLESLNQAPTDTEEKPEYCFQPTVEVDKVTTTPLLNFIKQRRLDRQKMRDEKREERRRKEVERKRVREDDRKVRKNPVLLKKSLMHSNLDAIDEYKPESSKYKEKKLDDFRHPVKIMKPPVKEYTEKRPFSSSRDMRRSPVKVKPKSHLVEREHRRTEYKNRRDELKDEFYKPIKKDEKLVERKVKKYSERREEQKNELKKHEVKIEVTELEKSIQKAEIETKFQDVPISKEKEEKNEVKLSKKKEEDTLIKSINESDNLNDKDDCKKDDPRVLRQIRNKDRPTMAIYQPGMGFRKKKQSSEPPEDSRKISTSNDKIDTAVSD